jgi:hypothetical protein
MDTISTANELVGVAAFALLVLAAVRPCVELERLIARRDAGVTRHDINAGAARYLRLPAGTLVVVRVHPSVRVSA